MPDGSQTYSYTNSNIHRAAIKIKNINNTEIIWLKSKVHRHSKWIPNQFSELFDSFGESKLYSYQQQQKPDACDEIMTVEQNQSNTTLQ